MDSDDIGHVIRQAAFQGSIDYRPHVYGYIASYDPDLHRVRCIIPSLSDEDGHPALSGWMPIGTVSGGSGYGLQVVYKGGASLQNPTAGEQVLISVFDRVRGVAAVPCVFYSSKSPPPSTALPKKDQGYPVDAAPIAGGDVILSNPAPTDGGANSVIRIKANGEIEVWGCTALTANVQGPVTANIMKGDLTANVQQGQVTVSAPNGPITLASSGGTTLKVDGDSGAVVIQGDLEVSKEIVAHYADAGRTTMSHHRHGTSGTVASATSAPTPGL